MNTLLPCPYCSRTNVEQKELDGFGGMCGHCWMAYDQMVRQWSVETIQIMAKKAIEEKRGNSH